MSGLSDSKCGYQSNSQVNSQDFLLPLLEMPRDLPKQVRSPLHGTIGERELLLCTGIR